MRKIAESILFMISKILGRRPGKSLLMIKIFGWRHSKSLMMSGPVTLDGIFLRRRTLLQSPQLVHKTDLRN
jgi:hypothetical protein